MNRVIRERRDTITQEEVNSVLLNIRNSATYEFIGDLQETLEKRAKTAYLKEGYIHIHSLGVTIPSAEKIQEFKDSGYFRCLIRFKGFKGFDDIDFTRNVAERSLKTYKNTLKTFDDDFWKGLLVKLNITCVTQITTQLIKTHLYEKQFCGKKDNTHRLYTTILKRWVFFITNEINDV